jgi:nitrite reductase (cytochrome c-552)
MRTQDDTISTPYGGSVPYSKLERYPAMVRIWAGYAFSKDHNEERGHYYTTIDQKNTQRVEAGQPARGLRQLPRRRSAANDRRNGLGDV